MGGDDAGDNDDNDKNNNNDSNDDDTNYSPEGSVSVDDAISKEAVSTDQDSDDGGRDSDTSSVSDEEDFLTDLDPDEPLRGSEEPDDEGSDPSWGEPAPERACPGQPPALLVAAEAWLTEMLFSLCISCLTTQAIY
jgi:hypothetical protein